MKVSKLKHSHRLLIYATLLFFLSACSSTNSHAPTQSDFPQGPLLYKFKKTQAQLLSGQHHMHCCMEGGSQTDQIKKISLGFQVERKLSRDEGRAIVIDCVNQIIKNVRASDELKPYLLPQGFDESNVYIEIHISPPKQAYHPNFSAISFSNRTLKFFTEKEGETRLVFYKTYREPYEEAIAILEQQGRGDILLPPNHSDLENPIP